MRNLHYHTPKKRGIYANVGKKIKGIGVFIFAAGVLASIAVGIYYLVTLINALGGDVKALFANGIPHDLLRPLVLVLVAPLGGSFAAWLVSLFFYSWGEFIDRNT